MGVVAAGVVIVAAVSTAVTVGGMSMEPLVGVGVDEVPVTMDDALEALVLQIGQANGEATQQRVRPASVRTEADNGFGILRIHSNVQR